MMKYVTACCSIGVIAEKEPPSEEAKQQKQDKEAELGVQKCNVFGMEIKALTEDGEPRALDSSGSGDKAVESNKVQQYLRRSFGTRYEDRVVLQDGKITPLSLVCPFMLSSLTSVSCISCSCQYSHIPVTMQSMALFAFYSPIVSMADHLCSSQVVLLISSSKLYELNHLTKFNAPLL